MTGPPTNRGPHDCPGGCGTKVAYVLPWGLRTRIVTAWRGGHPIPQLHADAIHNAKIWYKDHPLPSAAEDLS